MKINVALSKNTSRTRYTIKIKLKLRKLVLEKKVFQYCCLLKDGSELAEVTTGGRLFHTRAAATPSPVADGTQSGPWYNEIAWTVINYFVVN